MTEQPDHIFELNFDQVLCKQGLIY